MIGLWITLGILAFFLLLLLMPVVVRWDVDTPADRKAFQISWLGLVLLSSTGKGLLQRGGSGRPKKKKQKKKKKPPKPKKEAKDTPKTPKWKRYWQLFQDVVAVVPKPLRRLWKGISIRGLVIGVRVGCFDAMDCAQRYGKLCAAVYPAVALLRSMMRVQVRGVQVCCAFGQDRMDWITQGKLQVCPLAVVMAALSFVIGFAIRRIKSAFSRPRLNQKGKSQETESTS